MAKKYDYRKALVKLVGKGTEFVFNPVKVNTDTITRVSTYDGKLEMFNGSDKYEQEQITSEMLSSVYCIVRTIRTQITDEILKINKELLSLGGYDTRYYKPENWRKSFDSYNINRLKETMEDYKFQLKRKKECH